MSQTLSQQEQIRRMFLKSERKLIAKKLKIRYQIVFKACNPKYAPKTWQQRLTSRHEELSARKASAEVNE